ncbi:MAG: SUMF1/EgtB/PvdO family nonheme iron enzyme [Desulfohalobiaceae bacterium]
MRKAIEAFQEENDLTVDGKLGPNTWSEIKKEAGLEETVESSSKPGETWTEPETGMEFVWVPGGCYQMGCGSWTSNCDDDEKPEHEVCVDGFWIGKYEVTIDQYRQFLQATGDTDGVDWDDEDCPIEKGGSFSLSGNKFAQDGDQPMVEVSWHGARAFAQWLSREAGKDFRLPTEAEWEYAARSGGKRQKYAGGDDVDRVAWYEDNSGGRTHEVGTQAPNGLGIFDMSGNVWEWCSDWYSDDYYSNSPKDNPQGPSSGSIRVYRGGGWGFNPWFVRAANRYWGVPDYAFIGLGFRLCLPQSGER